ncbi:MAG: 30S ribosomal protein S23 [Chlorobi bacterium OLB5]|nr:MAG: 30S ribosomal protein S23 [Chlorobi bacterium OLB5]
MMKTRSIVEEKSYAFALRIIKLYRHLVIEKKEFVLSKQILRCGTSIGANVKEAVQAESRNDFIHKLYISLKEASETEYWLNLLHDSGYISKKSFESIAKECIELIKIITAIIKTSKKNSEKK